MRPSTVTAEPKRRWRFNETEFIRRELDGENLILRLDNGDYFVVEGTGNFILGKLLDGGSFAEIEAALAGRHPGIARDRIRKDLKDFVGRLERRRMIRPI